MSLPTMGVSITEDPESEGHVSAHHGSFDQRQSRGEGHVSGHIDCFDHRESREVKDMSLVTMGVAI
jgi:hypothetical protein